MIYLLAFLIPAGMYGVVLALTGNVPFGSNALLISDIDNQFAAFYTYFKHTVLSNNNLLYTFSKSLGGDMVGFSGYYLNNPFLFLLLPFKDEYIPAGIVMIIGIQLSLMGVSMAVFLNEIFKERVDRADRAGKSSLRCRYGILIFSTAYAFMGYAMAYITLPIYFCDLIMLPLVMLGIKKLVHGKKKLYIISLFLSIVFNYYLGYMICIFSVLYFIMQLIRQDRIRDGRAYKDFVVSSLAAGGLSAFSLLPTILSLRGQKEAPSVSAMSPGITFGIRQLIRNMFTGGFRGDVSNLSAPYIYVGEAVLIFCVFYLISKKINLRERLSMLALPTLLVLTAAVNTTDVIWHGFNAPVGFAHRFAFLICFAFIEMGFEGYLVFLKTEYGRAALDEQAGKDKKCGRVRSTAVLFLALAELILLTANAVISIRSYPNVSLEAYAAYYKRADDFISKIREKDASLYRIEKDFERNHSDSMMLAYNGLTHNSSCEKDYVKEFLAKMGIRYFAPIWTFYNQGSTTFTDCFLGVKYFVSRFDWTGKPYVFDFKTEAINEDGEERISYVYDNPYTLPLCFGMSDEQLATDMANEDLFEIQNGMAGMTIYTRAIEPVRDLDINDEFSVDIPITDECNLYFYATAPDYQGAELLINDQSYEDYFSVSRWNIVNIGHYLKGDTVNLKLRATDGPICVNDLYVYAEDISAIVKWYEKAAAGAGELNKISSSHLTGSISVTDSDRIVFSFPYEKAWKIKLNGKRYNTSEAFGALLSVEVPPGEYVIDMIYVPSGLIPGIVISVLTLVVCLGLTFCPQTFKIYKGRKE